MKPGVWTLGHSPEQGERLTRGSLQLQLKEGTWHVPLCRLSPRCRATLLPGTPCPRWLALHPMPSAVGRPVPWAPGCTWSWPALAAGTKPSHLLLTAQEARGPWPSAGRAGFWQGCPPGLL